MSVKIKNNIPELKRQIEEKKRDALTRIGTKVVSEASEVVPVDTGELKRSISYSTGDDRVTVGASADYAAHVELGTSRQRAQPYLEPAVKENIDDIKQIVIDTMNEIDLGKGGDE